jgi:chromosome segregation ATPase
MTKRRLTDLLREEAQKTSENQDSSVVEAAVPINQPAKAMVKTVEPAIAHDPADLKLIAELKATLEKTQKSEAALKQQVTELKQDLKTNLTATEKLHAEMTQLSQAKIEIETDRNQVKKDNLRLAEANIQLTAEIDQIKAGRQTGYQGGARSQSTQAAYYSSVKPAGVKPNQVSSEPEKTAAEKAAIVAHDKNQDKIRLSKLLRRPVGSNEALSKVNGQNIGWFD